jgi:HD-like signal output (HDOD) protein
MMIEHWNFDATLIETLRAITDPFTADNEKIQTFGKILHVVKEAVNIVQAFSDEGLNNARAAIANFHLDQKSFNEAVIAVQENSKSE